MNLEEKTVALEQLEQWQTIIEQSHWNCICQIEHAKRSLDGDFFYSVNSSNVKTQIQRCLASIITALDAENFSEGVQ